MAKFDPVSWETSEAALGAPAAEVTKMVERMQGEVYDETPYDAVKTIHDDLSEHDKDRTTPSLGEPFITAYLLEKKEIIAPNENGREQEYQSIVDRRPPAERLEELFWDQHRTL